MTQKVTAKIYRHVKNPCRSVAQPGSAPALGAGSRWFKSSRSDQKNQRVRCKCLTRFLFTAHFPQKTLAHDPNLCIGNLIIDNSLFQWVALCNKYVIMHLPGRARGTFHLWGMAKAVPRCCYAQAPLGGLTSRSQLYTHPPRRPSSVRRTPHVRLPVVFNHESPPPTRTTS